ncbi:MAG: cytochrome c maturation protein CcmE [Chloroflexota bacterium]|nr:MAG: cytochrome c maturation protein CcmE [Chloroflexota bacterium]
MATSTFTDNKPKAKSKYQLKYLIGAALIIGVIGYLIFFGLTQTSQWSINVTELKARGASAIGQGMRVSGQLEANSVAKDVKANKIAFVLTDGVNRLPVSYNGVVPDTFDRAVEVVAEGKLNPDGSFTASNLLARCPSKYDESKIELYDTSKMQGNVNYGQ